MDAATVIALLDLAPHPEGGYFRETWRHDPDDGGRGAGTAIYFLLAEGERSHWHRVDADEVWLFHGGAELRLEVAEGAGEPVVVHRLGLDLRGGAAPQHVVPAGWWQAAESTGPWTLVSCTVAPAFSFDGFERPRPAGRLSGLAALPRSRRSRS